MATVAVVGAGGLVGNEILDVLESREFPAERVKLLGSLKTAGAQTDRGTIELLGPDAFGDVDVAFFAAGPSVAGEFVSAAVSAGARVIDVSSRFRLDPAVPLVVPEVNASLLREGERHDVVASPSATAIGLAVTLAPIAAVAGINRAIVSTYQGAASGGRRLLKRLSSDTIALLNARIEPGTGLGFDCVPRVGAFLPGDATSHELHVVEELRRVLAQPDLAVSITAVRVPAFFGQGMSVHLETERRLPADEALRVLRDAPGLIVQGDASEPLPTLAGVAGSEGTHVGRVREDPASEHGLALWIALDSVRKGAALNAVEIAEILVNDAD
jgi:aspartate-semialdehyde dehydrogenase